MCPNQIRWIAAYTGHGALMAPFRVIVLRLSTVQGRTWVQGVGNWDVIQELSCSEVYETQSEALAEAMDHNRRIKGDV